MNRILLFCALGALWGCRTVTEPTAEAITLCCSPSESAKVGALTAGDEVAVFARVEGTEDYFLEAAQYGVGSDGHSLTYGSTVYYPEPKQAVNFYAYFPYHTGTFSVPSDQNTAAALKQADLCWANASTTPVATPVPLTFQHLFARLIVQTNEPTEKITCLVVPSGTLDPATAQFTLTGGKNEVFTTGSELIVPVQPLARLVLTVLGIDYVFEGSINLQAGQTTTLNLTLNPSTKTATLNGSSTTAWIASSQSGSIEQTVSNILTLHWAAPHSNYASVNKIVLTLIPSTNSTAQDVITIPQLIASQSSIAACTYTISLSNALISSANYPYTVSRVRIYSGSTLLNDSPQIDIKGAIVYRAGNQTLGISSNIYVRDAQTNTIDLKQWSNVAKEGASLSVKITTTGTDRWTASVSGTGLKVSPLSGLSGEIATLSWSSQDYKASERMGTVRFSTDPAFAHSMLNTTQLPGPTVLAPGVTDGNLMYVGQSNAKQLWLYNEQSTGVWSVAMSYCVNKGFTLPSIEQLRMLYAFKGYTVGTAWKFNDYLTYTFHWSSTEQPGYSNAYGIHFATGGEQSSFKQNPQHIRCVQEK